VSSSSNTVTSALYQQSLEDMTTEILKGKYIGENGTEDRKVGTVE
jgi:hypothetical protein